MKRLVLVIMIACALMAAGCVGENTSSTTPHTALTQMLPQTNLPQGLTLLAVLTPHTKVNSSTDVLTELDRLGEHKDRIPPIVDSAEGVYSFGGSYDANVYIVRFASPADAQSAYFAYLNQSEFQRRLPYNYERFEVWLSHGKQITEIKDVSPSSDIRLIYAWYTNSTLFIVKGNSDQEQTRALASLVNSAAVHVSM